MTEKITIEERCTIEEKRRIDAIRDDVGFWIVNFVPPHCSSVFVLSTISILKPHFDAIASYYSSISHSSACTFHRIAFHSSACTFHSTSFHSTTFRSEYNAARALGLDLPFCILLAEKFFIVLMIY